jgi:hypothetical protein
MVDYAAAESGVLYTLQDAATTGNGNPLALPMSFRNHCFIIRGDGTIGAGAIQLETADNPSYAGTWAPLTTPITVVSSAEVIFQYVGILPCVRARISTTVTTTTVTVFYYGGKNY